MKNYYFKAVVASSVQELEVKINEILQNDAYYNVTFIGGISESPGKVNKEYRQSITYGWSKDMLRDVWPKPRNIGEVLNG